MNGVCSNANPSKDVLEGHSNLVRGIDIPPPPGAACSQAMFAASGLKVGECSLFQSCGASWKVSPEEHLAFISQIAKGHPNNHARGSSRPSDV